MADNIEDLLSCKICSEEFQENGDHTPKLLPCTHTLCKRCLIQLLGLRGGRTLTCPECRAQHAAPSGEGTFCQNRDLLAFMKYKEKPKEVPRCSNHGEELKLFCKETQCQMLICTVCMKEHRKHDVVGVDQETEEQKEELLTDLTSTIDTLSSRKNHITPAQKTVDGKNEECLVSLRDEKEKTLNIVRDKYDSLIAMAANQKEESRREMTSLDENLVLLTNIKRRVDEEKLSTGIIKNYKEALDSIKQHTEQILSEPHIDVYMEYTYLTDKEWLVGQLCGKLQTRNQSMDSRIQNPFCVPVQQPSTGFNFGTQQPSTFQPPAFSLGTRIARTAVRRKQPIEKPREQGAGAVNETTQATSLVETEEPSASTSSQLDPVEGSCRVQQSSKQSSSISEVEEEPEGSASGGIKEITGALNATNLEETPTFQPPAASLGSGTGFGLGISAQKPSSRGVLADFFESLLSKKPPRPDGLGVTETTQETSQMETEEASASTSSEIDQVLPKFHLKWSFKTSYYIHGILYLTTAGEDSVFVSGWDVDSRCHIVTHYNLLTGEERCTVTLDSYDVSGMTTVLYNNRTCIALSYWGRIYFRPVDDLTQVVHSLDVSPHLPIELRAVTSSPSQLLYYDRPTGKVYQVNCSTSPPTVQGEIPIVYDGNMNVADICTSRDLLVVTRRYDGVFGYTLPGGELKWNVSGKLPGMEQEIYALGITADDQGHMFVSDIQNNVHVLSAQDGTHLGVVLRQGQEGVGRPVQVTWHQDSKSLVVAHIKGRVYHLSVFTRQK